MSQLSRSHLNPLYNISVRTDRFYCQIVKIKIRNKHFPSRHNEKKKLGKFIIH